MSEWFFKYKGRYFMAKDNPFGDFGVMEHETKHPHILYRDLLDKDWFHPDLVEEIIPRAEKIIAGEVDMTMTTFIVPDPFAHVLDDDEPEGDHE